MIITKTIKCVLGILLLLELYTSTVPIKHDLLLLILFPSTIYFSLEALFCRQYVFSFVYIITSFVYNSIHPLTAQPESWILINSATSILFITDVCIWAMSELEKRSNNHSNTVTVAPGNEFLFKDEATSELNENHIASISKAFTDKCEAKLKQQVNEVLTSQTNKTIEDEIQNYFSNQSIENEKHMANVSKTFTDKFETELKQKVNETLTSQTNETIEDEIQNYFSNQSIENRVKEQLGPKTHSIKDIIADEINNAISDYSSAEKLEELGLEKLQDTRERAKVLIKTLINNLISQEMGTFTSPEFLGKAASLATNEYSDALNKAVKLSIEQYIDKNSKVLARDLSKDNIGINNLELVSQRTKNILREHINECLSNIQIEEFANEYMESIRTKAKEYVSKQVQEIVNKEAEGFNNKNIFGDLSQNRLIKKGENVMENKKFTYPSKEIREMVYKALSCSSENKPNESEELMRKALLIWGKEEELSTTDNNLVSVAAETPLKCDLEALDGLFSDLKTTTKTQTMVNSDNGKNKTETKKPLPTTFTWPPRK